MASLEVPRPDLADALWRRARSGPPLLLTGPPGAGKTTLLLRTRERLAGEGWAAVYLDLMGAASSPERFVLAALEALPAAAFGRHLARATELRRLVASGRTQAAGAVQALLELWAALDAAGERPVALLLDEATEIRSLAYFAGLREVDAFLARALRARPRGTLLATSFPTLARRRWSFETLEATPLPEAAIAAGLAAAGLALDAAAVAAASFGWPRYVALLARAARAGEDVAAVWAREMAPGGALESACRATYEALLLRSRGYGMSKAVLGAVAEEEGLNLTALVARLGRTPGAVRDYLQWLVGVDALRMAGKRYVYVDGLLRHWVRLHARGVPPSAAELAAAAAALVARTAADEGAGAAARDEAGAARAGRPRADSLMEID
jgi:DNA polymerase III delta prime subunit